MMAEVNLDPVAIEAMNEQIRQGLQERVNNALQSAIRVVRDEYDGEPEDVVYARLDEQTRRELGPELSKGLVLDETELRTVAADIACGEAND